MPRITAERGAFAVLLVVSFCAGALWSRWDRGGGDADAADAAKAVAASAAGAAQERAKSEQAAGATEKTANGSKARVAKTADDMREQLGVALGSTNASEKFMQLAALLAQLSPENWRGALEAFAEARKRGEDNPEAWALFVRHAGEIAGREVVAHFAQADDLASARLALTGWAAAKPAEALAWIGQEADPELRRRIVGAAMRGLASSEPDLALTLLEGIPLERRKLYTNDLVPSLIRGAGFAQAEQIVGDLLRRAAERGELNDGYVRGVFSDLAEAKIRRAVVSGDLAGLSDWVKGHANQPYSDANLVRDAVSQLAGKDPLRAIAWLDELHAQGPVGSANDPVGYGLALATWIGKAGPAPAGAWIVANQNHPRYDHIVRQLVPYIPPDRATEGRALIATIKDPALRQQATQRLGANSAPAK